ncbi:MAG: 30S ribosomal protein S3ae [Candidatus Aenigmatarchaeota archaeon]
MKKQWYEIIAPKMFGEKLVGETLSIDPKYLIGRKLEVSLLDISKNYAKFYIKLILQIERVEGNKVYTKLVGHDVMRERIYRMVQHHGRRVDCIQDIVTKDNVKVRVKTVFMLLRRVGASMKKATRKFVYNYIENVSKETNFENFINMILDGSLQEKIKKECSKIYPVSNVEIRKTEVLK